MVIVTGTLGESTIGVANGTVMQTIGTENQKTLSVFRLSRHGDRRLHCMSLCKRMITMLPLTTMKKAWVSLVCLMKVVMTVTIILTLNH